MVSKTKVVDGSTKADLFRTSYNWVYDNNNPDRTYGWRISSSSTTSLGLYPAYESVRTRTWRTTDQWRATKDRLGYLPTQPYSDTQLQIIRSRDGVIRQRHSTGLGYQSELYGNLNWGITPSSYMDSDYIQRLVDEAKLKALLKAKDMKVNIPVLFAEAHKTWGMLCETVATVSGAYRDMRRGRFRRAARRLNIDTPKGAANNWLAYRYGWLPMLSDVKGLAELAAQQMTGRHRFSVGSKSSGSKTFNVLRQSGVTGETHGSNLNIGGVSYSCRAGLLLEPQMGGLSLASQIGILDPALVAWELVPFSFVFDWFISVGDWLQARTALAGLTVLAGFTSQEASVFGVSRYIETRSDYEANVPPATFTYRSYGRSQWDGSLPLFSLGYVNRDPLNIKKMTTLWALWKQRSR